MQQTLVWKPWHNPDVENLRLNIDAHGIIATYVLSCEPRPDLSECPQVMLSESPFPPQPCHAAP